MTVRTQLELPIFYDEVELDAGLRIDIMVEDRVVVEVKAVEEHKKVFEAQLLSDMKLSGKRLGLLINFNVPLIRSGIKRMIL